MTKPDFFIVGAPRCGTTALNTYLQQHPDIFMAQKESHFFANDHTASYVVDSFTEYEALFSDARQHQCVGEASVNYLYSRAAPENIKKFNSNAKILIMLRNPIDMLYSLYHHYLYAAAEDVCDFEAALDADEARKTDSNPAEYRCFSGEYLTYKDMVRFNEYLERYIDVFGRKRVHVVFLDQMMTDPASIYRKALAFLDVREIDLPPHFEVINKNRNVHSHTIYHLTRKLHGFLDGRVPDSLLDLYDRAVRKVNTSEGPRTPIDPEVRQRLQLEFKPDVDALGRLLSVDLSFWGFDRMSPT